MSKNKMKIVINSCYGGFGLSKAALKELGVDAPYGDVNNGDLGIDEDNRYAYRSSTKLVEVVEKLGAAACGSYAKLEVIEIPEGVDWYIDEYDGMETVREVHRSWG